MIILEAMVKNYFAASVLIIREVGGPGADVRGVQGGSCQGGGGGEGGGVPGRIVDNVFEPALHTKNSSVSERGEK